MASSKTVLRPLCVRAEHSRYFTEPVGIKGEGVMGWAMVEVSLWPKPLSESWNLIKLLVSSKQYSHERETETKNGNLRKLCPPECS